MYEREEIQWEVRRRDVVILELLGSHARPHGEPMLTRLNLPLS